MRFHTFLCGSSKSKERDAYYINYDDWFWGLLHREGITEQHLTPEKYRDLGQEYGIYLTEIVDPEKYIVGQDSDIEPHQVESGLEKLVNRIESYDPNRIGFKGKNAATWFYRHCEGKEITDSNSPGHKSDRKSLETGELDWNYFDLDYYLLTSLRAYHWDEDIWAGFWRRCKDDVRKFRRENA